MNPFSLRNFSLISNQSITTLGNFLFLSLSSIFLELTDFFELSIFISVYIVSVVIIFHIFFYQLNFLDGDEANKFFISRYHSLLLFLLFILTLGSLIGYAIESFLCSAFIAIEIYRRNLTQLKKIRESILFGACFQLLRLSVLIIFKPHILFDLYIMLSILTIPFLITVIFNMFKNGLIRYQVIYTKDDYYILVSAILGTLQFYIPIFTSNLFFTKEFAAAIISVRFFANTTNIFAELIEYGFKEIFKEVKSNFTLKMLLALLFFSLFSSIAVYIVTLFLLPFFFPKTEIFSGNVDFAFIAVIFWIGQILDICRRIIGYSFNFNGNFRITFQTQIFSISFTAIYFTSILFLIDTSSYFLWAISYILIPLVYLATILFIQHYLFSNEKNLNNY